SCLTVSIGLVSVVPKQAILDFNKLMTSADKALYEAKSCGRNCLVVYNQLEHPAANDGVETATRFAKTIPFSRIAGTAR
ncbi:MAG TPA: GGDEF domain-containing protein, partial [Candidatus Acidoferrum sp.]|nr:GGDEF domain-containing protein [Candidatus Acidoferrum sp.]